MRSWLRKQYLPYHLSTTSTFKLHFLLSYCTPEWTYSNYVLIWSIETPFPLNWKLLFIGKNLRISLGASSLPPTRLPTLPHWPNSFSSSRNYFVSPTCPFLPFLAQFATPLISALIIASPWSTCTRCCHLTLLYSQRICIWGLASLDSSGFSFTYFLHFDSLFSNSFHMILINAYKKIPNKCLFTFHR